MNGSWFAEQLAASGLDDLERQPKADLFDSTVRGFRRFSRTTPDVIAWVPGRLEVFGTHTDYAGGRTLVAALPRGVVFAARGRRDATLHVIDALAQESVILSTNQPMIGVTGWRHYVEVVCDRLRRNFPGAALGADIAFASDLPRAAGMSSSSALIVGVASTLVRLSGIREREEWGRDVRGRLEEAGYYACIENGRSFGALVGHQGVGTHGGSEDHAAMLCAAGGVVTSFAFVPMRQLGVAGVPDDWQFVVASSGVAAEKTGGALTSYNKLAKGAAALLDVWNTHESPVDSLAAALASSHDAGTRLRDYIERSRIPHWPSDALSRRLLHFLREDARVAEALPAFLDTNVRAVGELALDSQADSEGLLGNQVVQTIALSRVAIQGGAFAARSFGAGFGGSVWALVPRERAAAFADEWLGAYEKKFSGSRPSVTFVAPPGPSLIELHS